MSHDRETELLRAHRPPRREVTDTLAPGTDLGSWRVVRHIATGGCGSVYEVAHRVLDRSAAVKILHADLAGSPAMVARFVLEAKAVNVIRHPGIVDIFDIGELPDGRPYMAMELLAEENLEDRLDADGRCRPDAALALFEALCDALGAAHARGIIHRDIKARNIGFARGTSDIRNAKVLDFGIAKLLEPEGPNQSSPTQRVGTPQSMSPEQIRGERVDPRTDVYGLGVLLFHVLTGRYPFEADDSLEVERMHLEATPPRPSELAPLPPGIDRLVARAMAKDPIDRPASVGELLDEIRSTLGAPADERSVPALAVHVGIYLDQPSEAELDRVASHQAEVAERLQSSGFAIALATATSTLGVQVLPDDVTAAAAAVRDAVALLAAIERALRERDDAVARAEIATAVHAATATVRERGGDQRLEVTGGEVLDSSSWIPAPAATTAVYVSPAARALAEDA